MTSPKFAVLNSWENIQKQHLKGSHPVVYEALLEKDAEKQREKEQQAKSRRKPGAASPQSVSPLGGQMTLEDSIHKSKPYDKASARYTDKLAVFVAKVMLPTEMLRVKSFENCLHN